MQYLEYQGDLKSLTELHTFYKLTAEESLKTNKLQKAIVRDYKNKTLVDSIIKILTQFLNKDNLHSQSIFNTDSARNNYAAKHKDLWKKDPICEIIKTLMQNYKRYKFDRSDYRKYNLLHKDDQEFINKDDSSDDERRGIEELDELCDINKLISHIKTDGLYDEIIAKLSPILNYNIKIKTC